MQNIYNTVEMLNKIKIVKTNPSFGFVGYSDQDPFFFFFFFFFLGSYARPEHHGVVVPIT